MVKMIHALTGTVMYVDEARQDAYLAAGHSRVDEPAPCSAPEEKNAESEAESAEPVPAPVDKKSAPTKKRR